MKLKEKGKKINVADYKLKKEDVHRLLNYATKVPSKAAELKKETRKQITTAIAAAFGFVIAFAWRDAIRKAIDTGVARLGIPETAYAYEFIVAIVITIICVFGIMIISKYNSKE